MNLAGISNGFFSVVLLQCYVCNENKLKWFTSSLSWISLIWVATWVSSVYIVKAVDLQTRLEGGSLLLVPLILYCGAPARWCMHVILEH